MDARIALIVAAILTAAGGITLMSKLERGYAERAEVGVDKLRDGVLKFYQQIGVNRMAVTLDEVFQNGLVDDPDLKKDPWNNPWYYQSFSSNVSLEGTLVNVHFAVIYSAGKDGVNNSPALSSELDYAEWQPLGDDIGIKVSTRDIEVARKAEYVARAQLIVDKLEALESTTFVEAQNACAGAEQPTWCSDLNSKNYTQFNFYPKSDKDKTEGTIYYQVDVLGKTPYVGGNEDDMQRLMGDLGLPTSYSRDPWGRILNYHSNVTGRTDPPFSASLCFSLDGGDCFESATNP
ncbi:MAG: hypothetical protein WAZ18_03975 [Alphaproteobacteria bacterium]